MNEIEKIAKILDEADCVEDALFVDFDGMAKALINAGYGDVKQAVREFAEKVKKFLDGAEVYFYNGEEEGIWDSTAVAEQINELIKEVCGE